MQPDLAKMMDHCGMKLSEWNDFEVKLKVNKDLIKAINISSTTTNLAPPAALKTPMSGGVNN